MAQKKFKKKQIRTAKIELPNGYKASDIDYKNVAFLKKFMSSRHKIFSGKVTGLGAKNQRKLKTEIKKARVMGLLPFTDRHALS